MINIAHCESYGATKAGLVGLTHAKVVSLEPRIRVHCLSPDWIDVRHERAGLRLKHQRRIPITAGRRTGATCWGKLTISNPVGRGGKGKDIAACIEFLGYKRLVLQLEGCAFSFPVHFWCFD